MARLCGLRFGSLCGCLQSSNALEDAFNELIIAEVT